MKLDILGTKYEYSEPNEKTDPDLKENAGYCDYNLKKIVVCSDIETRYAMRKIQRHEVIHAFMHESGLDKYTDDETLVDWIANMFPKILKVVQTLDAV